MLLGSEGSLGSEIARGLHQRSLPFIAVDKNKKSNLKNIQYFCADFSKMSEVSKLTQNLSAQLSEENILISAIGKFDEEDLLESLRINLISLADISLHLSKKCINDGKKLRLIFTGSAAGVVGSSNIGYGVAKAGLNGLVVSLSKKFANYGITTIAVNPGIFTSSMSKSVSQKRQKFAINQTHLKRAGTVSEIANVVMYAALDAPNFMTGTFLSVSGGQIS